MFQVYMREFGCWVEKEECDRYRRGEIDVPQRATGGLNDLSRENQIRHVLGKSLVASLPLDGPQAAVTGASLPQRVRRDGPQTASTGASLPRRDGPQAATAGASLPLRAP